MSWGIFVIACYFLAAMGLLVMGLTMDERPVPIDRIDPRELPEEIPDMKEAA